VWVEPSPKRLSGPRVARVRKSVRMGAGLTRPAPGSTREPLRAHALCAAARGGRPGRAGRVVALSRSALRFLAYWLPLRAAPRRPPRGRAGGGRTTRSPCRGGGCPARRQRGRRAERLNPRPRCVDPAVSAEDALDRRDLRAHVLAALPYGLRSAGALRDPGGPFFNRRTWSTFGPALSDRPDRCGPPASRNADPERFSWPHVRGCGHSD
jgi:hypothetical protein